MSSPNKIITIELKTTNESTNRYYGIRTYSKQAIQPQQRPKQQIQQSNKLHNQDTKQTTLFVYKSKEDNSIVNQGEITFTKHDYLLLRTPRYLNDTIISFFMQYHLDKNVPDSIKKRIHLFNSFFFAKIKSIKEKQQSHHDNLASFNRVSRWLRGVKIFSKDFLIMPVCERDHWVLVIVCYPERQPSARPAIIPDDELYEPAVIVLNSWRNSTPPIKKILAQFLAFQWKIERKENRNFLISNVDAQSIKLLFPTLPQQRNNYNCGVYLLNYFNCFLKHPRLNYIKMFRGRDMSRWFENYSIDINNERNNMRRIVDNQREEWNRRQLNSSNDVQQETKTYQHDSGTISTSTSRDSDNEVHMIIDDNDKNLENNIDPIVVINIS